MLSRLIAIMVAASFVIMPAYAEEGTSATEIETTAVAKPEKLTLFDQLREAYEKNDREAMGKILDQMQERRKQMRQRRAEFRRGRQGRGFGPAHGKFGLGQRRGYRQMREWQQANQGRGGWNKGPGQFRDGRGHKAGRRHHSRGGRFGKGGCEWNKPRREHTGRRFGYEPRRQRHRWSDTDCEREARCKQRSEWDW